MDPITTAIVAAVTAGVTATGKKAFSDAYQGLKELIKSKLGQDSRVPEAIKGLEDNRESKGWQMVLSETMALERADQDPDILNAAEQLIKLLSQIPGGEQHIMIARGKFIAQADRGSSASININKG